jgi:nucleoside-diphosphate-sugar epimerase
MNILLSGWSGFVGNYLYHHLSGDFDIEKYVRDSPINVEAQNVLHLAGVAHDLNGELLPENYFLGNFVLTKHFYDAFLLSQARVFITVSSVKAVADVVFGELDENYTPNPSTSFGQSKLKAEEYIFAKELPEGKRVYVLRPCMIHGPGNKGNLNLLYKIVSKNIPWPLGAFENKRSFCSIDNLMFIIKELIEREDIPSGIYNVADDEPLSTNELIKLIAKSQNRNPKIWNFSKKFIEGLASIGDKLQLPLNTERLHKLTASFVVSNAKIKAAIGKPLPKSSRDGLMKTFKSLNIK